MRRVVVSFLMLAATITAAAAAESRAVHPQPTLSALSALSELSDAGAPEDPVRAAAKARQEHFDRQIARRSDRAVRSVCTGCESAPAKARRPGARSVEARADAEFDTDDDTVVDEPAEAPRD